MLVVPLLAVLFLVLCWFVHKKQNYWNDRQVPQTRPAFLIGDHLEVMQGKQTTTVGFQKIYDSHPNARYVGAYISLFPTLMLKDPDLIKQVTIQDFKHFTDHHLFVPENDPYWKQNLFALKGEEWHQMRMTLSPVFTSSKVKIMFNLISQYSKQFVDYFLDKDEKIIAVELRDELRRFTSDALATCFFGVECNSLMNRNNEFYAMGFLAANVTVPRTIKLFAYGLLPKLMKIFKLEFFPREVAIFFRDILMDCMRYRRDTSYVRHDMIHLLMEAQKASIDSLKEVTDDDIVAQALIFFMAGYDTVSFQLTFMIYELTINPKLQDRLYNEVREALKKNHGQVGYDMIMELEYLDMVFSETLRKWSQVPNTDRMCKEPYLIEPVLPNEKPLLLEKGVPIWIPVRAIHRDPKNFPDPEVFDPERFSKDNKSKIRPGTYLPFGTGPRSCIGKRLGTVQVKTFMVHMVSTFRFVMVDRTRSPIVLKERAFFDEIDGGHWIGLQRRNQELYLF